MAIPEWVEISKWCPNGKQGACENRAGISQNDYTVLTNCNKTNHLPAVLRVKIPKRGKNDREKILSAPSSRRVCLPVLQAKKTLLLELQLRLHDLS